MKQVTVTKGFMREFLTAMFVKSIHPGDAEVEPFMQVDRGRPVMPGYEWETPDEWSARIAREAAQKREQEAAQAKTTLLPPQVRLQQMEESARFDGLEVTP